MGVAVAIGNWSKDLKAAFGVMFVGSRGHYSHEHRRKLQMSGVWVFVFVLVVLRCSALSCVFCWFAFMGISDVCLQSTC